MHLDLMRDEAKKFPKVNNHNDIHSIRIWHCKYKTLQVLEEFPNVEELVVASFPDDSLDFLVTLSKLKYLSIIHLPKISSLDPLAKLLHLDSLSLSTSPAWDAQGKCTIIQSLAPLTEIEPLHHLELFGVCPENKLLSDLDKCKNLVTARFSQFQKGEGERFYKTTGVVNEFNPKPTFKI
ncbi:hypothetical protein [Solimicrobium silvestre]|nr:hypothetical protein [Solimicrobium silvestre]